MGYYLMENNRVNPIFCQMGQIEFNLLRCGIIPCLYGTPSSTSPRHISEDYLASGGGVCYIVKRFKYRYGKAEPIYPLLYPRFLRFCIGILLNELRLPLAERKVFHIGGRAFNRSFCYWNLCRRFLCRSFRLCLAELLRVVVPHCSSDIRAFRKRAQNSIDVLLNHSLPLTLVLLEWHANGFLHSMTKVCVLPLRFCLGLLPAVPEDIVIDVGLVAYLPEQVNDCVSCTAIIRFVARGIRFCFICRTSEQTRILRCDMLCELTDSHPTFLKEEEVRSLSLVAGLTTEVVYIYGLASALEVLCNVFRHSLFGCLRCELLYAELLLGGNRYERSVAGVDFSQHATDSLQPALALGYLRIQSLNLCGVLCTEGLAGLDVPLKVGSHLGLVALALILQLRFLCTKGFQFRFKCTDESGTIRIAHLLIEQ